MNHLNYLAPAAFLSAEEDAKRVHSLAEKGAAPNEVEAAAREALAEFEKAREKAASYRADFQVVVDARGKAIDVGARNNENKALRELDEKFMIYGGRFERGRGLKNDKDLAALAIDYRRLAQNSAKDSSMGRVEQYFALAEQEGAKKYAPESFEKAKQEKEETERFIKQSFTDARGVMDRTNQLESSIKEVIYLTRLARELDSMNKEEVAIRLNRTLGRLEWVVGSNPDEILDQGIGTRLDTLASKVEQSQMAESSVRQKDQQLALTQQNLNRLKGEVQELEGFKTIDQKVSEVRKLFDPAEASVLRDGNRVVIRLKTINFPSGSATVRPENYALLSKVIESMNIIKSPKIEIEGHTDSVGGAALNKALSEQRAEAVKNYIEANARVENANIDTAGYGFEHPIASNKDRKGRAMNRRIDVVMDLETSVE